MPIYRGVALLCMLVASSAASAQITGGAIVGVVTDAGGGVLPGVTVTATNIATNQAAVTHTNAQGYFEFPLLPAARYRLEAQLQGFQATRVEALELNAGVRRRFDVRLAIEAVTDRVDVVAAAPLVNATTTSLGIVMDQRQVEALPLNGRNFQQLVGLQAGVVNAPSSSTGGRGGIEFNGSPALGNNLMLDGVDMSFGENNGSASDTSAGASGGALINTISVEAVAEFKATGSAFSAEYGRATGGVLNVTTKSGSNQLHGTAFEFFRHDALDANSFFSNLDGAPKPPLRWNQFGGNLGGPVLRDRLFFFFNYEGAHVRRSDAVTGNVPTPLLIDRAAPEMREVLQAFPDTFEPTGDPYVGLHRRNDERRNDEHTYMGRVDVERGQHRLAVRYNYNHQDFFQPIMPPEHPRVFPTRLHNAVVQDNWTISPSVFNELRVGINRSDLNRHHVGTELTPAWISVSGGGLTGLGLPSDIHFMTTTYSINDNLTYVRGRHSIKAGFEIRNVDSKRFQIGLPTHRYNGVDDLIADRPNDIQVIFGSEKPLDTTNYAVYIQDDWRVSNRLQLNAGLRYEYSPPLSGAFNVAGSDPFGPFNNRGEPMFDADRNNFGPRLGVIYDAIGDQRLVLRAGGGVTHAPAQPFFYYDMAYIDPNVPFLATFTENDIPAGLPTAFPFPRSFVTEVAENPSLLPEGFNLSRSVADYDRADEYAIQWNGAVQYALTSRASLQAAYVGSRALKLYSTRSLNLVDPITGERPDQAVGEVVLRENAGRSKYDALQLSLNQRLWNGLALDVYYTYGRSRGYYGPDGTLVRDATVQDPNDIAGSAGPKPGDVRHRFVNVHSYELPTPGFGDSGLARALLGHWTIQGIITWRSGLPINVTAGRDLVGNRRVDGQRPDLVPGVDPYIKDTDGLVWLNAAAFDVDRPLAEGRFGNLPFNALRGPSALTYDFALHKRFDVTGGHQMTLRLEAFNVLNRKNLNNPVSNLSTSTFGQITGASSGRNIQIGLKYAF
ncbi:MAG: TonB-dependent receptor plug domain-containing protein [Luteitalea sp.]|nr:TonB-dependent receptor plug domain-containing protein [Luteitalea sp.]